MYFYIIRTSHFEPVVHGGIVYRKKTLVEYDQLERVVAWGQGPEVLAGGLTKMKIV
jgi:hypothetical protein